MMVSELGFPLQSGVPDWLTLAVVIVSIGLAVLTISLMLLRLRPAPGEETPHTSATARDPVLLLSAVGVVVLAIAAWLLR